MIAYHGTTQSRARMIFAKGLLPLPPSRRVWFAEARRYAMGRARTQAARASDLPVVLACDLDLAALRRRKDIQGIVHRKGIIAVDGPVPAGMLRCESFSDLATVPREVAAWLNGLLGLKARDVVRPDHPGLIRLSRWINARGESESEPMPRYSELLAKARRWLPEYFVDAHLPARQLRRNRRVGFIEYEVDARAVAPDPREAEALSCLDCAGPDERARGLGLLAEIGDPDLFDWCAMCLDDEAADVQVAALRTMLKCDGAQPDIIEPLAASADRRVRATAVAALAAHAGEDAPRWIERGLRDPEPCVRVETLPFLRELDPRRHRPIFELARNDPNPDIAARAQKLLLGR